MVVQGTGPCRWVAQNEDEASTRQQTRDVFEGLESGVVVHGGLKSDALPIPHNAWLSTPKGLFQVAPVCRSLGAATYHVSASLPVPWGGRAVKATRAGVA